MRLPPSRPFPYDYTRRAASRSGGSLGASSWGGIAARPGFHHGSKEREPNGRLWFPSFRSSRCWGLPCGGSPRAADTRHTPRRHAKRTVPGPPRRVGLSAAPRGPNARHPAHRAAWAVMGRMKRPRHAGSPGRAAACELVQECRRLRTCGTKNGQFVQECRRLRTCGTTSPIAPAIHGKRLPYPRLSQSVHLRLFKHGTSCSDGTQPLARFETVQEPAGADPAAQSKGFLDRGAPSHTPESQSAGFVDGREEQQERSQEVAAGTADTPKDLNTWQPRRCCRQRHSPQASTTDSYNKGPPTAITPRAGSGAKSSPATATEARPRRWPSTCRARPRTPRAWRLCRTGTP